jgi:hypothetical protein
MLLERWDVDDLRTLLLTATRLLRKRDDILATVQLLKNGDVDEANRESIEDLPTARLNINVGIDGRGNALYAASYISDPALHMNGDDSNENPFKIVQLLIKKGASINEWTGMHGSALIAASAEGNEKIVQLLLVKGADPNADGRKLANAL